MTKQVHTQKDITLYEPIQLRLTAHNHQRAGELARRLGLRKADVLRTTVAIGLTTMAEAIDSGADVQQLIDAIRASGQATLGNTQVQP